MIYQAVHDNDHREMGKNEMSSTISQLFFFFFFVRRVFILHTPVKKNAANDSRTRQ